MALFIIIYILGIIPAMIFSTRDIKKNDTKAKYPGLEGLFLALFWPLASLVFLFIWIIIVTSEYEDAILKPLNNLIEKVSKV